MARKIDRRTRAAVIAATAIGAAGLSVAGLSGIARAGTVHESHVAVAQVTAAAAVKAAPRLLGCNESSSTRPARFNPICNDGNYTVIDLHWSTWSGSAAGRGGFYVDRGKVVRYPVKVSASRVEHGVYTRFSYQFSNAVPRGFSRSWTISYYSGSWHGRVV